MQVVHTHVANGIEIKWGSLGRQQKGLEADSSAAAKIGIVNAQVSEKLKKAQVGVQSRFC